MLFLDDDPLRLAQRRFNILRAHDRSRAKLDRELTRTLEKATLLLQILDRRDLLP